MEEDFKEAEDIRKKLGYITPDKSIMDQMNESSNNDTESETESSDKSYEEAVIIIDKSGMGQINLTEEEHEKLEQVKKIKLEEIEVVDIKKFKTKKPKKHSLSKILKRRSVAHTTNVVLPSSGYTAVVKGASTYEIASLAGNSQDLVIDAETKWSTIYDKIVSTSIGDMNFNDFLRATSQMDYEMLIYGILCATFPDADSFPLICDKCGKTFEHKYSIKSLILHEQMSDKLKELISVAVDNSHVLEDAKRVHNEAPVNQVTTIKLPVSGYIVDIHCQSAHEFIYNSVKALSQENNQKYVQASTLSIFIKTIYIPDDINDPETSYFEFSEAGEIAHIIYELQNKDILAITKYIEPLTNISMDFGFKDVKCGFCGKVTENIPMDIESILFYQHQQAMQQNVE